MDPSTSEHHLSPAMERFWRLVLEPARTYHRYEAVGLENIPDTGAVLLVVSHSFATYDGFLLGGRIFEERGRLVTGLADDLMFKIPKLKELAWSTGLRPASPGAARALLDEGYLVAVAPGGMSEALRPKQERYRVRWGDRKGFVKLALRAQVPLVLAGCGAADDLYTVYGSRVTDAVYRRFKAPLPIVRGMGPTLIPRPVRLRHFLSEPIVPPVHDPQREQEQVDALHATCVRTMNGLLRRR
jgi:1-acyl-sn-glycerol-3-phosphate acyltransferase